MRLILAALVAVGLLARGATPSAADPCLWGYASTTSCSPGDTVGLHASGDCPSAVTLRVFRVGDQPTLMLEVPDQVPANVPVPDSGYVKGFGWPTMYTLQIPSDWPTGMYDIQMVEQDPNAEIAHVPLVVLGSPSAPRPILVVSAVSTYQAYNPFGGKSLYDFNSPGGRSSKVSFDRPYESHLGLGQPQFERPFVRWLERSGFQADYATDVDLALRPEILNGHRLLIIVGHNEYWSLSTLDAVSAFAETSGNVAVFGGNTCYWAVRYEDQGRTLVCYKSYADPEFFSHPESTTVRFRDLPVWRPECQVLGVMYPAFQSAATDSVVLLNDLYSWVTEGLEHERGARLGSHVLGYEWDTFVPGLSPPRAIHILETPVPDPPFPGIQAGVYYERQPAFGYPLGGGGIFNAGTIQWSWGLDTTVFAPPDPRMQRLTANLLRGLSQPLKVAIAGEAVIHEYVLGADPERPLPLVMRPAQVGLDSTTYDERPLLDDGVWPDSLAGDAIYTGTFPLFENQRLPLSIVFHSSDGTLLEPEREYFWLNDTQHIDSLYSRFVDTLTVVPPVVGVAPEGPRSQFLTARPDPFLASLRVSWEPAFEVRRLSLYDAAGRLINRIPVARGASEAEWNGHSADGRPARAGVYWIRAEGPRGARVVRVVKLRS